MQTYPNSTADNFEAAQVAYRRKIKTFARNAFPHLSGHDRSWDVEDIEQELLGVLWRCVIAYDPNKGATFNTFACRSFQNHISTMVRRVTATKRKAVGGVVSMDVEAVGLAVDEAFAEWSAEDIALAELDTLRRLTVHENVGGSRGRRRTERRTA